MPVLFRRAPIAVMQGNLRTKLSTARRVGITDSPYHSDTSRHINGLDGLRAVAALSVLAYHVSVFAPPPSGSTLATMTGLGWAGVDLFFVISGFILFLPFARNHGTGRRISLKRYATNRLRRILPAYWFNLFVLVSLLAPSLLLTPHGIATVGANATFTARYLELPVLNGVYWTLYCEVAFYVLLPALAIIFVGRRALWGLPIILFAGWLYRTVMIDQLFDPGNRAPMSSSLEYFPATLDEFAFGMAAASLWVWLERRGRRPNAVMGYLLIAIGLLGIFAALGFLHGPLGPTAYWYGTSGWGFIPLRTVKPMIAFSAAILLIGVCYYENALTRVFELRPIKYIGVVSYGIYLWHLPLAKAVGPELWTKEHPLKSFGLAFVVVLLVTLAWAAISYRFIESAFMGRRKASSAGAVDQAVPGASDENFAVSTIPEAAMLEGPAAPRA